MANTKLLLVEDDENLAYMEKSCFEDIIGGYEVKTCLLYTSSALMLAMSGIAMAGKIG